MTTGHAGLPLHRPRRETAGGAAARALRRCDGRSTASSAINHSTAHLSASYLRQDVRRRAGCGSQGERRVRKTGQQPRLRPVCRRDAEREGSGGAEQLRAPEIPKAEQLPRRHVARRQAVICSLTCGLRALPLQPHHLSRPPPCMRSSRASSLYSPAGDCRRRPRHGQDKHHQAHDHQQL